MWQTNDPASSLAKDGDPMNKHRGLINKHCGSLTSKNDVLKILYTQVHITIKFLFTKQYSF